MQNLIEQWRLSRLKDLQSKQPSTRPPLTNLDPSYTIWKHEKQVILEEARNQVEAEYNQIIQWILKK